MITVIGILVGAIIIAIVWMCVYFGQEIHDVMAEMRARTGGYYHTPYEKDRVTYSQYYDRSYTKTERERATETIRELISEREQTKDVIRELDGKLEEGLLLIEAMDKRGIRGGKIPHAPTPSEEDWDNWKNSLCTECLEKIEKEEEE